MVFLLNQIICEFLSEVDPWVDPFVGPETTIKGLNVSHGRYEPLYF